MKTPEEKYEAERARRISAEKALNAFYEASLGFNVTISPGKKITGMRDRLVLRDFQKADAHFTKYWWEDKE